MLHRGEEVSASASARVALRQNNLAREIEMTALSSQVPIRPS